MYGLTSNCDKYKSIFHTSITTFAGLHIKKCKNRANFSTVRQKVSTISTEYSHYTTQLHQKQIEFTYTY